MSDMRTSPGVAGRVIQQPTAKRGDPLVEGIEVRIMATTQEVDSIRVRTTTYQPVPVPR